MELTRLARNLKPGDVIQLTDKTVIPAETHNVKVEKVGKPHKGWFSDTKFVYVWFEQVPLPFPNPMMFEASRRVDLWRDK